jgi:hypothetical protein
MKQELAAFVCSHIFHNTHPVLLVAREHGDWMYLCGASHAEDEDYHVVGMTHLLERDSTLRETLDLSDNSEAERSDIGLPWTRRQLTSE